MSPRQRWPSGFAVSRPWRSSPRITSQTTITGIAKNDRKNTCWPDGTSALVVLMIEAIAMKMQTDAILKRIALNGCIWPRLWKTSKCRSLPQR